MFKITNNILQKNLTYNNEIVLTYKINYPSIISNNNKRGIISFNIYNKKIALELQHTAETELYKQAVEVYKFNKQKGYPKMVFEVVRNYKVTLNTNTNISLFADEYIFSGGAHGNTTRTSQNWDITYGKMIKLEDIYRNNPYFVLDILKQINEQILQNPKNYFYDSCMLVIETFNPNNFYLTENSIVIYFQAYDIAPYSSGIPEFNIERLK